MFWRKSAFIAILVSRLFLNTRIAVARKWISVSEAKLNKGYSMS